MPPRACTCRLDEGRERARASGPALSALLHVDVCVSCAFSATSSHRGGMGGVGWADGAVGPVGRAGACLELRRGRLLAAAMMCGFP